MKNFGTLEYVLDRYSKTWSWKITGQRAVSMVSKVVPESWYGDGPNEAIVPDSLINVQHLQWIQERYPMEILSKSIWQKKALSKKQNKQEKKLKIEKLERRTPGKQFKGKLLNFQKEGLDFLLKSYGNALLADEMGLGKTVETLAYLATEKQAFPALIVAPLVTLTNWQREIGKFLKRKSRNGRIVDNDVPSSKIIRHGKSAQIGNYDFYIINYELLHKRLADLKPLKIKTIVCDEVQNLRSKTTKKYAAVKQIAAFDSIKYRIGLSGTPLYNRGS